jgi:hypothetical protein
MENYIIIALEAAKKYPNDKAIQSLVSGLENAISIEKVRRNSFDFLQGYRKGVDGEDGYQAITYSLITDGIKKATEDAEALFRISVIADCLLMALSAIGDDIDY